MERRNRRLLAALAALALAGSPALAGCSSGPDESAFREAFAKTEWVSDGAASNNYVKETPYEVTSFELDDLKKVSDGLVEGAFAATIENESFTTQYVGYASALTDEKALNPFTFEVRDMSTTPKKGIDFIEVNGEEVDVDCELSEDATSCTTEFTDEAQLWFVDSKRTTQATYTFKDNGWSEKESETTLAFNYHDIDGAYKGKTGDITALSRFEIRDVDAKAGTFTIDYTYDAPKSLFSDAEQITGTLSAVIDTEARSNNAQSDGISYYFEAKGTSSGGDGQANAAGYFTTSDSGEHSIELQNIRADSNSGFGVSTSGNLFKQEEAAN